MKAFRLLVCLLLAAAPAAALELKETPALEAAIAAGKLPPVAERAPAEPLVADFASRGREVGAHGGTIRSMIARARDIRMGVVYGYARLVGYDESYRLQPDILKAVDVQEGRIFTLTLRKGHRWSDGAPFTTEDFRYWWEDVANHPELSPAGAPEIMLVDGEPPVVTVIDETTIRYEWKAPNPRLLPAFAEARPFFNYAPAHYLKQFHAKYADPATLETLVKDSGERSWAALHNKRDTAYDFDNVAFPTLQPWMNTSEPNSQRYLLARNPFFHRVDPEGRQLPYADGIEFTIAAGGLIPAKANRGEADLQARGLSLGDAPVLKKGEANGYVTRLWSSGYASEIALYPNLNYNDPVWRAVLRDVRFRRALSLAISRQTISKSLYFGLARPVGMAALPQSPLYEEANALAWADHDKVRANELLDAMGLLKGADGVRRLPDGRPMEVIAETAGERAEEIDALELIAEMWRDIGVKLIFRPLDRDILRNKVFAGEAMMPVWFGWNVGIPTADAAPTEIAPVDQAVFSWPKWGQHFQTKGQLGEPVDMPEAQRLMDLFDAWLVAADEEERAEAWREMLKIHADQVFAIGLVASAPQPVTISTRLRNLPAEGVYAWEPGAHFGIYRIDEAFFAD
jgi:peptide/nickel transport system substrate-binding protein